MNLAADMSLWGLVMQASTLVKAVMLLLLAASVASWAVIFAKRRRIKRVVKDMNRFEDRFWSGGNVRDIYDDVHRHSDSLEGMPALFAAGYEELKRRREAAIRAVPKSYPRSSARCVWLTRVSSKNWNPGWRFWPPSARSARTSGCSAPSGAS